MNLHHFWIGVDVSKRTLDVNTPALGSFKVENSARGHETLMARLAGLRVDGIVMEATGGYEQPLLKALHAHGIAAAVVNPARVRAFATGTGQLAKTDRIDAQILAGYGAFKKPPPTPLPSSQRARLRELIAYRAQIVAEITAREAQRDRYSDTAIKARADAALEALQEERKLLARDIEAVIEGTPELARAYAILTSTPSVGLVTAAILIAELPELGTLSRRQIASLAGLAPFPRESGLRRGYRAIRGGRAEVRVALYNALRSALRFNPNVKVFADRLHARGKPFKIIATAAMRKLLTILNAMMKSGQPWRQA